MSSKDSLDVNKVLERLKSVLELDTDTQLAETLDLKPNSLSMQRARNSLNHNRIVPLCDKEGISLDWLYGFEEHAPGGESGAASAQHDELKAENERLNQKSTSLEGRIEGLREALRLMGAQGGDPDEGAQSREEEVGFTATEGADVG